MAFELPPLPYSHAALAARGMQQETLELHHDKHHQAYVTALNGFVEKDPALQGKSLEEIVQALERQAGHGARVQQCRAALEPHPVLGEHVAHRRRHPGRAGEQDHRRFRQRAGVQGRVQGRLPSASSAAAGAGWCRAADGKLKVTKTPNGSNPLATGEGTALLGCDVWEHSYYLDFRNRRPDYVHELAG